MAEYLSIDNLTTKGKLSISVNVFDTLVKQTLAEIDGISSSKKMLKKNQYFKLNRPIQTTIHKGIVHVSVYVDILKGKNIQTVQSMIINQINNTFEVLTEQVPFDVQVKVESII